MSLVAFRSAHCVRCRGAARSSCNSVERALDWKSLDFSHHALGVALATALLAGCGGSQPPIGAPGAMM